jgi:hypothetical protein
MWLETRSIATGGHQRGFYVLTVFFFNEALLELLRLFPLKD